MRVTIETARPGAPFPRIHEGRYEVDPERTGGLVNPTQLFVENVAAAGVRLLRVGVGIWYPGQEPTEQQLVEREWFHGSSLDDVEREELYNWTHLDRVLDVCINLDCDVLLSIDYMPASLADAKSPEMPE